jgi:hypothetical protein
MAHCIKNAVLILQLCPSGRVNILPVAAGRVVVTPDGPVTESIVDELLLVALDAIEAHAREAGKTSAYVRHDEKGNQHITDKPPWQP